MPFKSKAQQRFMFAAEAKGDLPKGTAEEWAEHTTDISKLPKKVKESAFEQYMKAAEESIALMAKEKVNKIYLS